MRGQLILTRQQTTWKIVSDTILSPGGEKLMPVVAPTTSTQHSATTAGEKQAEKVVNSAMEAWKKGDVQAIQGLLTRKAQETIAKPEKVDGESHHFNPKAASPDATYSIQSVVAEGTTILAAVRITDPMDPMAAKGAVLRWRLKPEGQTWRIAKMVYVGPDDIASRSSTLKIRRPTPACWISRWRRWPGSWRPTADAWQSDHDSRFARRGCRQTAAGRDQSCGFRAVMEARRRHQCDSRRHGNSISVQEYERESEPRSRREKAAIGERQGRRFFAAAGDRGNLPTDRRSHGV